MAAVRLREKDRQRQRERERERKLKKGGEKCCDYEACSDAGSLRGLCKSEYIHQEKKSS